MNEGDNAISGNNATAIVRKQKSARGSSSFVPYCLQNSLDCAAACLLVRRSHTQSQVKGPSLFFLSPEVTSSNMVAAILKLSSYSVLWI